MGRSEKRLTAAGVKAATAPGRYADGGGLYLEVDAQGRRRWLWRYRARGKRRDMGLGSAAAVSLAEARAARDLWRKTLDQKLDPIDERAKSSPKPPATFGEAVDAYIETHGATWRNAKHRAQWRMTLDVYAKPLHDKPVDSIATADVLAVLKPIWIKKPETASRVRGRIEQVLDAARAVGHIDEARANPARWRGHLDKLLPRRAKASKTHHEAMPWAEVPAFVAWLRERRTTSALALEFAILTAARTGEVIGATWAEVDEVGAVWSVPAARMKGDRVHRVPLCARALEILGETRKLRSPFLFPSRSARRPLSNMAFLMLLRRRKLAVTTHGFRSAFSDWRGDATTFDRELAEAALAHLVGDAVERAYRRGDALERRREMMTAWSNFIDGETAKILKFERK